MITYLIGFLSLQPMWILAGQIHVLPLQRLIQTEEPNPQYTKPNPLQ